MDPVQPSSQHVDSARKLDTMNLHASRNALKRKEKEQTREGNRLTAQTEAKEHKHKDQEAEDLQYMRSKQQINFDMILTAFTSTLSVQSTQQLQKSILTL